MMPYQVTYLGDEGLDGLMIVSTFDPSSPFGEGGVYTSTSWRDGVLRKGGGHYYDPIWVDGVPTWGLVSA